MHTLNGERIDRLERHGVRNGRLAAFHERSAGLLKEAEVARAEHRHRDFVDRARRAWALAAAAYRDVERTQAGVVQGALFLLAVLIPFAHFAERLAFGFADLRRAGVGVISRSFSLALSPCVTCIRPLSCRSHRRSSCSVSSSWRWGFWSRFWGCRG